MKKLLILIGLLALVASAGLAQEKQYDVPGAFSFTYGDGWSKGPRKGGPANELDWLVSTTNPNATFHAVQGHADMSYDDWIKHNAKIATPDRVLASQGEFASASGEKGFKMVWNVKAKNGAQFVTTQYLFRGKGDTQILLSGTVDKADAAKFEPVLDGFAKSLTIAGAK